MISIERKCDRSKNLLLTVTKNELITILKKYKVKGLYNKNKTELCEIFNKLQKKSLRKKQIGKKKLKFDEKVNVKTVKKYKGVAQKKNTKKQANLKEDVMFKYCLPEIFSKHNLWLKEDVEKFSKKLDDYEAEGYDEWLVNNNIIDLKSNTPADEQIENLKVEIDFCKEFLDSEPNN